MHDPMERQLVELARELEFEREQEAAAETRKLIAELAVLGGVRLPSKPAHICESCNKPRSPEANYCPLGQGSSGAV